MTNPTSLETQELELRIEKLRCEVDELKRSSAWHRRFGQWIPLLGAVLPALALLFAIRQFTAEQEASRLQLKQSAEADKVANERAFMQPVLDLHLNTYVDAANAAGTLAGSATEADRRKAIDNFWRLYWGPMVMFETDEVARHMVAIGDCLNRRDQCSDGDLKRASLALGTILRHNYLSTWGQTPEQYASFGSSYKRQP